MQWIMMSLPKSMPLRCARKASDSQVFTKSCNWFLTVSIPTNSRSGSVALVTTLVPHHLQKTAYGTFTGDGMDAFEGTYENYTTKKQVNFSFKKAKADVEN